MTGPDPDGTLTETATRFGGVVEFFASHLAQIVCRRAGGGRVWCDQWWRHPEALERLTALWYAWETARAEGGSAMSSWWAQHFDPHYAALADGERGPFQACKDGHDSRLAPLGHTPPDPRWEAEQTQVIAGGWAAGANQTGAPDE